MSVDILLVHPGYGKKTYQKLADEFTAIDVPLWDGLLAQHLRSRGVDCDVYDANLEGWDADTAQAVLNRFDPRLVAIMVYGHHPSASTQTMPTAGKIASDLKSCGDVRIAMGGTHPSALPERTLAEEKIDYVIRGEGAHTLCGLAGVVRGECSPEEVPGLCYLDGDGFRSTRPAPLLRNLDEELPGYSWDLLSDIGRYRAHNWHCFQDFGRSESETFSDVRSPYVSIYTSLGCPYSCSYCCINALFGKPGIRYWSISKVVSWIDTLVHDYGVRNIRIADELFVLSAKRVEEFCDLIIERGYDLNIWAYGRVDTVEDKLLVKLKKAGVNWLCLGIESGNSDVRLGVNKNIRVGIRDIVQRIQDAGIYIIGNYMFGLPDDSLDTMQETLDLSQQLNCAFANFYVVVPYPGSRLYEESAEKGLVPAKWEAFSQHSYETTPLPTRFLAPSQVLEFRDKAFQIYYNGSEYRKKIDQEFGPRVSEHISKMLEIKIDRRLTSER